MPEVTSDWMEGVHLILISAFMTLKMSEEFINVMNAYFTSMSIDFHKFFLVYIYNGRG